MGLGRAVQLVLRFWCGRLAYNVSFRRRWLCLLFDASFPKPKPAIECEKLVFPLSPAKEISEFAMESWQAFFLFISNEHRSI